LLCYRQKYKTLIFSSKKYQIHSDEGDSLLLDFGQKNADLLTQAGAPPKKQMKTTFITTCAFTPLKRWIFDWGVT
jgi:hypothetical protein